MKDFTNNLRGVVFINQTLGMGGAENFNCQLLGWFFKNNIPVKAWTTYTPFKKNLSSNGIESHKIPFVIDVIGDWKGLIKGLLLMPFGFFYYGYLTYINRKSGVILMTGFIEKILVTPWAKLLNIPVVWIEYGPLKTIFSKFLGFPGIIYRMVSKMPDFVVETSQNTKKNNLEISGIPGSKTTVLPCGILPLTPSKSVPKKLTAYCVSRLEPGKGQDLLISAWPKVLERFPEARLYFIGRGDFKNELEKQVSHLDLESSVKFLGRVADLIHEVSPISLAIFPSVWPLEGFGIVLLEAMSLAKPIVCFNMGPYPEIVDKSCAILVEKGNVEKLSEAIIKIFSHPEIGKKMGLWGKRRFQKLFTIDKVAPSYGRILLEAQIKHVNFSSAD